MTNQEIDIEIASILGDTTSISYTTDEDAAMKGLREFCDPHGFDTKTDRPETKPGIFEGKWVIRIGYDDWNLVSEGVANTKALAICKAILAANSGIKRKQLTKQ